MAAYWPGALTDAQSTETNRTMARRMRDYRKIVFSRTGGHALTAWNNVEQVTTANDEDLAGFITALKAEPGKDIHLSGGSSFARSVIGLGLVDAFHFFVYPVFSPGASWFSQWHDRHDLRLMGKSSYENGVVGLHYAATPSEGRARPQSFAELL